MAAERILEFSAVRRRFAAGSGSVEVLRDLDLQVGRGERVAIMGASGSGKTTLLHLAAGMDQPDAGRIDLVGHRLDQTREPQLSRLRARHIGLVFQDFNLIESLTVSENIGLPLWLNGRRPDHSRVAQLAAALGIESLLERIPEQLSGGERQRVAIARALIHEPDLLLADEPTGSLDPTTAAQVLALFGQILDRSGATLVMVTHSEAAAAICQRRLELRQGRLVAC